MVELVKIPLSNAEYSARFAQAHIPFFYPGNRVKLLENIFAVLSPYNISLGNVEAVAPAALVEHKLIFRLPELGIIFQVGAEGYSFTKEGASWQSVEEYAALLNNLEDALLKTSDTKRDSCQVTLAMHLQPLNKTRREILAPFVPEPLKRLLQEREMSGFGNHLRWPDGDVLIDFSVGYANGIFLRLTSQFVGQPLNSVLEKVNSDQRSIFRVLNIEEATQ
jgi:hypothetical protein